MQLAYIDLDRRVGRLRAQRRNHPYAWRQFQERLRLSWLIHDFAMEGVALTLDEVQRALHRETPRHHCDGILLSNIRLTLSAIGDVSRTQPNQEVVQLDYLKHFHALLLPPNDPAAGRYRKVEGPMVPYTHELTRTPSISYRLRRLAESMQGGYRDLHPIQAAALIHHEFMTIWPFDERTGSAGRLLMNDWLLRADYPPAIIHAVDRQNYYAALESSPDAMIHVLVQAVETTLRASESFVPQYAHQIA